MTISKINDAMKSVTDALVEFAAAVAMSILKIRHFAEQFMPNVHIWDGKIFVGIFQPEHNRFIGPGLTPSASLKSWNSPEGLLRFDNKRDAACLAQKHYGYVILAIRNVRQSLEDSYAYLYF